MCYDDGMANFKLMDESGAIIRMRNEDNELIIGIRDDGGYSVFAATPEQCDALRIALADHLATLKGKGE